jgi:hypothetical protein
MGKDNYQLLIGKLDSFIRKYYVNQVIRGVLYSLGLILALFLIISVSEYYMYYPASTRKVMFFSFVGISAVALVSWVFVPLMHYFRLGKVISHENAAMIVGQHFGDVKDKLLNILQLKKQSSTSENRELILASINQKTQTLTPVPFKKAIDLTQNKKYLRFALPPFLVLLALLLIDARIIKDSSARLLQNSIEFERPAPFQFSVKNKDLTVIQFDDYELEINIIGDVLPNEAFIDIDGYEYKLTKVEKDKFTYKFSNVAKATAFNFTAGGFDSKPYELDILRKPNIAGFDVKLNYPSYIGRKAEMVNNIGDLVVPEGTDISWFFSAQNTDNVLVKFSGEKEMTEAKQTNKELFSVKKKQRKDQIYTVYISNAALPNADSVAYSITVIPDLHPTITVKQFEDSTQRALLFFVGDASDDYGLSQLSFNYTVEREGVRGKMVSAPLKIAAPKQTNYDYTWDLESLDLEPGDKLTYYFETLDNDGVNGRKSARTSLMAYALPTVEEYEEMAKDNNESIKKALENTIKDVNELQQDIKEMRDKLLQKKELDWRDQKELEKLMQRQQQIEEQMQEAQQKFQENLQNQEEFSEMSEELLEKQEQLKEMFEELMDDEMKEMMEKMKDLLKEMDKNSTLEELENFEMNEEELEKEMDRIKELFKQLEFEQEMKQTIDKLNELAEKEEKLSEETEKESKTQEELKKEQEAIQKEFDKLKEDMKELGEKNKELQNPTDLDEPQKEKEEVEEEMKKAKEQLQQKQNDKASKSQKKASEKMKNMANSMQMQMQAAQMEQMKEDIEALRQLLENLVTLSFDQEDLMGRMTQTQINTPTYVSQVQEQFKIQDDFKLVEDSLVALSKRVFQIETFITEKVTEIKRDLKTGMGNLEERQVRKATGKQQRAMTGFNDLALMLSEVMEQMQQQMSGQMSGSQMCENPKGSGEGMGKMGEMQQQLNEQMKEMMEKMGKGEQPGKGKDGKSGKDGKGGSGMSKEFAEMAAKQAAIRKALNDMAKGKKESGQGSKALDDLIKEMDKTETDLVNKRLNNEMLKRQQDIMTRLLESDKADRQQEMEKKREAEAAREQERKMPPSLEEYIKQREAEIEMYKSVSPTLKPYYKNLVEEYYKSLKGE